jgi:hypothetical protein
MRQRVRFGDAVSLGRVALRGAMHSSYTVARPQFAPRCVCCNADTTRAVRYPLGAAHVVGEPFVVPVCEACAGHAFSPQGLSRVAAAFIAGGSLLFAAAMGSHWSAPLLEGAGAVWLGGIVATRAINKRKRPAIPAGHRGGFEILVLTGATLVDTENETLVDDLLARNSNATRLPTPLLWRLRGDGLPKATLK